MSTQPRCVLLELDKVAHSLVHVAPQMMRHPPCCVRSWSLNPLSELQERLADLESSLKSGDIYNEKILQLPKRKVLYAERSDCSPLSTACCIH